MVYIYRCDGFCDKGPIRDRPAFTAEFNEDWYDETAWGDRLRQEGYEPGDLVTLCGECVGELLIEH